MTTPTSHQGRPARDLSDEELAAQGKQAHDTRNWVFLHGTATQFANHTTRMLELEQEYLRRYPQRTWQGSGGAAAEHPTPAADEPATELLRRVAGSTDGRMHKLEVHQVAREVGLDRASLARLYTADPPLLATEHEDRILTDAGRERLGR